MAYDFPNAPAVDDEFEAYHWDGEKWTTVYGGPPIIVGPPAAVFLQDPPIGGSDSNPHANFRTICTTTAIMGNEFRFTIGCGTNLSVTHAGAGEWTGDAGLPSVKAPFEVVKFAGLDGFTTQSTPQTCDWTPAGELEGLPAGSKILVTIQNGTYGEGLSAYTAGSTNSTCFWQNDSGGTYWNAQNAAGLGYNNIYDTVYGVVSIETRGAPGSGGGGGEIDPPPVITDSLIPMTFNDPMFTGMTERTTTLKLTDGQNLTRMSIQERSGAPSIECSYNNTLTYCRVNSREAVRIGQSNLLFDHCYFEALGDSGVEDHADTVQQFVSAAEGSRGTTVTWKNSHIRAHLVDATAGYFSSNDWGGRVVMENCIVQSGPWGVKFNCEKNVYFYIDFKNVYFVGPWAGDGGPVQDNCYDNGAFVIERWENVVNATIVDGVLVPGAPTGMMTNTPLPTNLVTHSSTFDLWTAVSGTVATNVDKDIVFGEMVADRFIEAAATAQHGLTSNSISFTSGTTYTFSVYVKYEIAPARYFQLALPTAAFGANAWANFDSETMTPQTVGSSATADVRTPYGTGLWVRCILKATATATASGAVAIYGIPNGTSARGVAYAGSTGNIRLLCDAQVETGSVDRPYVKTP